VVVRIEKTVGDIVKRQVEEHTGVPISTVPFPSILEPEPPKDPVTNLAKKSVAGIIRHVLTTMGGAWAAWGATNGDTVDIFAGAVVALGGIAWSLITKYLESKRK
jgi:hypothetical protein